LWNPLFYLFAGLANLFIIGLTFHLLHDLLFSLSPNSRARALIYVNYTLFFIFTILIVAGTGIAFDFAAKQIWYFNRDLLDDPLEMEYTTMNHLFLATDVLYALLAVYWLVLGIIGFRTGRKMQIPSLAPVSMASSKQKQICLT
jgi:hypothetical protein